MCFHPTLKPNRKTTETQLFAILDRSKSDRLLARLGEPYQHRVAFFRRLAGGAGRTDGQARGAGRDGRV